MIDVSFAAAMSSVRRLRWFVPIGGFDEIVLRNDLPTLKLRHRLLAPPPGPQFVFPVTQNRVEECRAAFDPPSGPVIQVEPPRRHSVSIN